MMLHDRTILFPVASHEKLSFQVFCKTAAVLSLKIRDLLSELGRELVKNNQVALFILYVLEVTFAFFS